MLTKKLDEIAPYFREAFESPNKTLTPRTFLSTLLAEPPLPPFPFLAHPALHREPPHPTITQLYRPHLPIAHTTTLVNSTYRRRPLHILPQRLLPLLPASADTSTTVPVVRFMSV